MAVLHHTIDSAAHKYDAALVRREQLHQYREGYNTEKDVFIEFIDVGGHPKYEISRAVFYHDIQGLHHTHTLLLHSRFHRV